MMFNTITHSSLNNVADPSSVGYTVSDMNSYNSLVFTGSHYRGYFWGITTESFFQGASYNLTIGNYGWSDSDADVVFRAMQSKMSSYKRLELADCIKLYSNSFTASRGSLLLVTPVPNSTTTIT